MALDRILVAVAPEDEASADRMVGFVADVAGPTDATVVLLHAFDEAGYADVLDRLDFEGENVSPDAVARRHATVGTVRSLLAERGIETAVRGGVGEHAEVIVAVAEEEDVDLLVVGGRGRSPTGKAVFGSTVETVLRRAPCPVTYVRRQSEAA